LKRVKTKRKEKGEHKENHNALPCFIDRLPCAGKTAQNVSSVVRMFLLAASSG
jgi:hypothetical protein